MAIERCRQRYGGWNMKYLSICFLTLFCFAAQAADAQMPVSLFFTKDESAIIETELAKTKPEHNATTGIELGAVFFYSPENWTLWMNGTKWTPETDRADLHVTSVEPNEVHLSWLRNAKATPQDITLHPHQTFDIHSGRIVEGLR
jgi:hypothetical protein